MPGITKKEANKLGGGGGAKPPITASNRNKNGEDDIWT